MANGTVSIHSWNDGLDDDEGDPPLGTNYNARLDIKQEYNEQTRLTRGPGGSLRSRIVRPTRLGQDDGVAGTGEDDDGDGDGAGW